ncbi:MAG: hypothetical protein OXU74_06445 [Gemmatimonadota bacterium]|nr:hypothetical protein [Gemmatimonadota bacterium]
MPGDLRTWWEWLPAITHLLFTDLQYFGLAALATGVALSMFGRHLEARVQQEARVQRQDRQAPIPTSPTPRPLEIEFAELAAYFYELRGRFNDPTRQLIGDLTQLHTRLWSQFQIGLPPVPDDVDDWEMDEWFTCLAKLEGYAKAGDLGGARVMANELGGTWY